MLKNIPAILSPELLKVLMEMGHGDEIVLADRNFPAASHTNRLIRCDGHPIPQLLEAILQFLPLDQAVKIPVALMAVTPGIDYKPIVWEQYYRICEKCDPEVKEFEMLERFAFYERAKKAYAVVATGESSRFANLILRKGVVMPD